MKRIFAAALMLILTGTTLQTHACTAFCLRHDDDIIYGRNLDWHVGIGAVIVNQRGISKTAFIRSTNKVASWTSKYGSVTFNQLSKEFPTGGMNEKGLVLASLVSTAEHAGVDERPAINELQWIQYQLDTCATVGEVIRTDSSVRIEKYMLEMHYFVCDREGNSAVIEYKDGKLLHAAGADLPVPVLANKYYRIEFARLGTYKAFGGTRLFTRPSDQHTRFVRAAHMIKDYDGRKSPVKHAFSTLDDVAQGAFTKWQIVYDIAQLKIHFRTSSKRKIKIIDLAKFDFESGSQSLMLNVNTAKTGSVQRRFKPCTRKSNAKLMLTSMRELAKARIIISPADAAKIRTVVNTCDPK